MPPRIQKAHLNLDCKCFRLESQFVPQSRMAGIVIFSKQPFCQRIEIIIFLKNLKRTCLDPKAKWVQELVDKVQERTENKPAQ
ncbi:C-X-C motif chemokine 13-like isoform X2 [Elgaria multicarinata webbii]|uniref:C-X-C motif chemokine 13-like isoform X2 n=1 Tax=Elgaria multicarinata webbii TaxID=159646 RepID=UPI002FCD4DE9